MIRENEVMDLLGNEIPQINHTFEKTANPGNVYKAVQCFASFTKELIRKGDLEEVKHCFGLAEKLWTEGNQTVKGVIENVYVFSISPIIDLTNPLCKKVKAMLSPELRREYYRQTTAHGI